MQNRLLRVQHIDHYDSWCFTRDLKADDESNWLKYYETVITKEEKSSLMICKIYYKNRDLAAILRMFCKYPPIGCSFDLDIEYKYLEEITKRNEETKKILRTLFGDTEKPIPAEEDDVDYKEDSVDDNLNNPVC